MRWKYSRPLLGLICAGLILFPLLNVGNFARAGNLQTFAIAFVYGALALSYDLLFGFTGLLSFGHALFFAGGIYITDILISKEHWSIYPASIVAISLTGFLAFLVGAASLRTKAITFAMVTLAFAEAGHVVINRNFGGLTNGENGLALDATRLPAILIGVINTKYLYWLALATLMVVYFVVWWVTQSSAGRVFAALRDNELRVSVLGLSTYKFKLLSFVIAGTLAAFVGVTALVVTGSAAPRFASSETTISLLLMVVLGGAVSRWGAVIGGILYSVANTRLQDLSHSSFITGLPKFISGPLSEPSFILGVIFILIVLFAPGGISGLYYRLRLRFLSTHQSR